MSDEEIIRRLRSALDEVADAPAAEIPADTPPIGQSFGRNRWIAVAAAVALIGAATAVLVQRNGSDEPVANGTTTVASTGPTTTSVSGSTIPRTTVPLDPGFSTPAWYSIDLPWLTAGTPQFDHCCKPWPAPGPDLALVWGEVLGINHGLLTLRAHRSLTGGPATLTYSTFGFTKAQAVALEKQVTEGSGVPYVLDDPSMQLLGNGMYGDGELISQSWTNGGSSVALSVGDYRGQLEMFTTHAGEVATTTTTTVAGFPALRYDDDMGSTFVWHNPPGTWSTLHIDVGLSKRIDEILAAIRPAHVPADPTASTTTTVVTRASTTYVAKDVAIIDSGKGPMIAFGLLDSLPPQGGNVPLANFDWSMVDGEQTVNGTTWGENYDVTGTWDGTTFTLTSPPTTATHTGTPQAPTHDHLTPGCTLATMQPMLAALSKLDYKELGIIESGSYSWDGHCGVEVRAMFDTTAVRDAMAKVGNDVTLTFAFQRVG